MNRRALLRLLGSAALWPALGTAAPDYPSKPIRIIVPTAAGGISDTLARAIASDLTRALRTPVIVENRAGGNFSIAFSAVKAAAPDGYTLLWFSGGPLSIYPHLYKDLPYRTADYAMIGTVMQGHQVLVVPKSSKANSLAEYVAGIKAAGQPALVGVASIGGGPHLMMELFAQNAGFSLQPVVYRGEAPAVLDLLAGNVPAISVVTPSVFRHYQAGEVKILAVSSDRRVAGMPDVPTFAEAGIDDMVVTYFQGLAAPAGTPQAVIDHLQAALGVAVRSAAFQAALLPDMQPDVLSPSDLLKLIEREHERWGRLIRARKITVEP